MAYVINGECTNCGACESECPNDAITEKSDKRYIDPEACVDCGACESMCPVEAISAS